MILLKTKSTKTKKERELFSCPLLTQIFHCFVCVPTLVIKRSYFQLIILSKRFRSFSKDGIFLGELGKWLAQQHKPYFDIVVIWSLIFKQNIYHQLVVRRSAGNCQAVIKQLPDYS